MRTTIILSLACNLRCKFCFQPSFDSGCALPEEVLFSGLGTLLQHSTTVVLQGGEVTAHPNGLRFLRHLRTEYPRISVRIITNGVAITDAWIREIAAGHVSVGLSLNASNGAAYQKLLSHDGGERIWRKAYGNLLRLLEAVGDGRDCAQVEISMVVTEDSVDDLEPLIFLACRLGVNAKISYDCRPTHLPPHILDSFKLALFLKRAASRFIEVGFINAALSKPGYEREFWASPANLVEYRRYRRHFQIRLADYRLPPDPVTRRDLSTPAAPRGAEATLRAVRVRTVRGAHDARSVALRPRRTRKQGREVCADPWHGTVITARGEVLFCCQTPHYILGNINERSFDEIWRGERARHFRGRMIDNDYRYCDPNCPANGNPSSSKPGSVFKPEHAVLFEAGRYGEAIPLLAAQLSSNPGDASACYRLAYSHHAAGKSADALNLYGQALELGFEEFWVRYHRGLLLLALGRKREAGADLRRAAELDPSHEVARVAPTAGPDDERQGRGAFHPSSGAGESIPPTDGSVSPAGAI